MNAHLRLLAVVVTLGAAGFAAVYQAPGASVSIEPLGRSQNFEAVAVSRWYEANEAFGQVPVGTDPRDVIYDGDRIWISSAGNLEAFLEGPGTPAGGVVGMSSLNRLGYDGKYIWATRGVTGVYRINLGTVSFDGPYTTGNDPWGIAFDGVNIWVANQGSDDLTKIAPSSGATLATVSVGDQPIELAFDGEHIWVCNAGSDTVSKIDVQSDAVVATFPAGDIPHGIVYDGRNIWVSSSGTGDLLRLNPSTGSIVQTVPIGTTPRDLTYDGRAIWAADIATNRVVKIHAGTGAVIGTFATGLLPVGVTFDGVNVWTVNRNSSTLTKL